MSVQKVRNDRALAPISVPVTRRALVIGGGVAGIQAALDIADAGYEVVMVEREPSIGARWPAFPRPSRPWTARSAS